MQTATAIATKCENCKNFEKRPSSLTQGYCSIQFMFIQDGDSCYKSKKVVDRANVCNKFEGK